VDEISSRPIYKLSAIGGDERADAYEIGLTFAREDRKYVEQMAQILKVSDVALFMTIAKHIGYVDPSPKDSEGTGETHHAKAWPSPGRNRRMSIRLRTSVITISPSRSPTKSSSRM
jgi:hypothetical protein